MTKSRGTERESVGGGGRDLPIIIAALLFLLLTPALSTNQLVSLQGRVLSSQSGTPLSGGSLAVTIWTAVDNGTLLYSDNFANAVSDGFFDLMLGSSSELNLTYGQFYYLDVSINGEDANWTAPSGATVNRIQFQSTNGQIPPAQIQYNAINASAIQSDSINASHILGNAITAAKLAFNAINASHIIDNAITTAKIINDAITSAKIAPGAVNSSHLNSAGTYYMGKLGIGTTGPSADLEIKSSSSTGALNVTNGTGYPVLFVNASSQKVSIGTTNFSQVAAGHMVQIAAENNVSGGGQLAVTGRTNVGMQLLIGYDTGGNYGKIQAVEQNVAARALALNPIGGNVGIGTTSMTDARAKLHLNGRFSFLATDGQSNSRFWRIGTDDLIDWGTFEIAVGPNSTSPPTNSSHVALIITRDRKVGIGTTSPGQKLSIVQDVASSIDSMASFFNPSQGNTQYNYISVGKSAVVAEAGLFGFTLEAGNTGRAFIGVAGDDVSGGVGLIAKKGGYVGIGTNAPVYQLQLGADSAAKPSTNTWTISSDSRVKKDVRPFTDGLSVIEKIDPVWYKYNGLGGFRADGSDYIGVIGQDIQKAAPYTVNTYKAKLNPNDANETELLNFNSHALTFVLINSVKELDARVASLERENAELRQKIGS